jgi:hypothetical protein
MTDKRRFHYAELALDTLKHIGAFGDLISQPVDVEVIPNFDGGAERLQAWLIFASPDEALDANEKSGAVLSRATELLAGAGFPADELRSFVLRNTSTKEIEEGGGRFAYFR